jgi:hypothetical protein
MLRDIADRLTFIIIHKQLTSMLQVQAAINTLLIQIILYAIRNILAFPRRQLFVVIVDHLNRLPFFPMGGRPLVFL